MLVMSTCKGLVAYIVHQSLVSVLKRTGGYTDTKGEANYVPRILCCCPTQTKIAHSRPHNATPCQTRPKTNHNSQPYMELTLHHKQSLATARDSLTNVHIMNYSLCVLNTTLLAVGSLHQYCVHTHTVVLHQYCVHYTQ